MKKKKFNLLLNIATLCLCVAAIAFGVYSAKNASLNVSGTVGFTAHNVKAKVEAWISGFSATADGAPVTGKEQITADGGLLLDGKDASFNLGATKGSSDTATRYFSDLGTSGNPEDIVVEIKITSMTTAFNVLVSVDFANSKATADALKDIIKVDCDRSAAVLGTTAGTTEVTFTFTISLLPNPDGSYGDASLTSPSASNIQIMMNLEKTDLTQTQIKSDAVAVKEFTTPEIDKIKSGLNITAGDCYANKFPYYIEMGERENQGKIKWLIIGTRTIDSDNNETYAALTTEDKTAFSKGLMLNKTYVMLSEKVLYTESTTEYGISFQNAYANDDTTSPAYKNTNSDYSAQDYATSNVRSYLNGNTVQKNSLYTKTIDVYSPSGASVNLLNAYNLTNDPLYAKIQGRTLTNLYSDIGEFASGAKKWSSDYSGADENLKGTTSDKLWLLSESEVNTLLGTKEFLMTSTYGGTASSAAGWWLRSPCSSDAFSVRGVYNSGSLFTDDAKYADYGSRAAFLF